MAPIFVALLTGVLMIPILIMVLAFGVGNETWLGPALYPCGALALVLAAVIFRRRLWWKVTLEQGTLVLGGGFLARRVPCHQVTMIRADVTMPTGRKRRPDGAREQKGKQRRKRKRPALSGRSAVVPVALEISTLTHLRVHLRREDARHCLETLHRHCTSALAIDARDTEYMPLDPRKIPAARRRLARLLLSSGLTGLVIGLAMAGVGGFVIIGAVRGVKELTDTMDAGYLLMGGLPLASGGWYAVRRGLRMML